ncbi:alpha/beta fold hydrolase [Azospirillum sp. ST 5-10]|uniref:alpha/beta fold hydrolase n=1 Tax=unclassified Azospirillum TaxID=2630922 RepID=UPI003F49CDC0
MTVARSPARTGAPSAGPAHREGFVEGPVRLRCVEWGDAAAPAVVMLHGLRAYAHWFDTCAAVLAAERRVVALDQRGRGGSGWAADGRYTTDAYVEDLERLADALGLERFALVGHSMGGTNAVNFAARHPGRVERLVIVDSSPVLAAPGLARIRRELGATPAGFPDRAAARDFLRRLHPRASEDAIDTRVAWMIMDDGAGGVTWRLDGAIFDPRLTPDPPERTWAALRRIPCPTLMVRGALSDLVTPEMVAEILAALPRGAAVEVPGAGHMVVEDNPDGFNAAVVPFLLG